MKRILFTISLLLFSVTVSAQGLVDYCITRTIPIDINRFVFDENQEWTGWEEIDTVEAGTPLHVNYEGAFGNWLRIDWNDGLAWVKRWISYTEVSCVQPTPLASQQQSAQPMPGGEAHSQSSDGGDDQSSSDSGANPQEPISTPDPTQEPITIPPTPEPKETTECPEGERL